MLAMVMFSAETFSQGISEAEEHDWDSVEHDWNWDLAAGRSFMFWAAAVAPQWFPGADTSSLAEIGWKPTKTRSPSHIQILFDETNMSGMVSKPFVSGQVSAPPVPTKLYHTCYYPLDNFRTDHNYSTKSSICRIPGTRPPNILSHRHLAIVSKSAATRQVADLPVPAELHYAAVPLYIFETPLFHNYSAKRSTYSAVASPTHLPENGWNSPETRSPSHHIFETKPDEMNPIGFVSRPFASDQVSAQPEPTQLS